MKSDVATSQAISTKVDLKTLVIHPADRSTWFLDRVYKDLPNTTVVTGGKTRGEVLDLIDEHDRVMIMGHGSPQGLFAIDFPARSGYIVDSMAAPLLRTKKECIFIWCYASDFTKKHNIPGFATGMFISEVGEATACDVYTADQEEVDKSNFLFVDELRKVTHQGSAEVYKHISATYGKLVPTSPVAAFNHDRFHFAP